VIDGAPSSALASVGSPNSPTFQTHPLRQINHVLGCGQLRFLGQIDVHGVTARHRRLNMVPIKRAPLDDLHRIPVHAARFLGAAHQYSHPMAPISQTARDRLAQHASCSQN
jgi:hypothetical protein